ncbi:MAG: tRNA adenosine(34) deaminase TadA [Xanthomonadaceae bacterium]|nr:tRNA adenosine(34) deaminase TadA [Xanthomonadaceae bacterium]
MEKDESVQWMRRALELATRARDAAEVPVGAVVVRDGEVLGEGWNHPIGGCDPTLHAEVHAIREAARAVGNYRLTGATLYVTLEPCAMCAGAIVHARIARVVYGADDPKTGAVHSVFRLLDTNPANHRVAHEGGLLATESAALLQAFFAARRQQ